jgi:hypothetical protein
LRFASIIPTALALFLSGPVYAQAWGEFADRQDHFTVNYKTEKGTAAPRQGVHGEGRTGRLILDPCG